VLLRLLQVSLRRATGPCASRAVQGVRITSRGWARRETTSRGGSVVGVPRLALALEERQLFECARVQYASRGSVERLGRLSSSSGDTSS
jgi:hypothetical protein